MAKHAGSLGQHTQRARSYDDRIWEPTPWWHYRRWFGYTWMQCQNNFYSGPDYLYQTDQKRAREVLKESCDGSR